MAERSETAVGATTGRPRAAEGRTEEASEATAQLSVEALSAELTAEADASAGAPSTAVDATPADATRAERSDAGAVAETAPEAEAETASEAEAETASEPEPDAETAEAETAANADAEVDAETAAGVETAPEPAAETDAASVAAPERHSGDRIARRYRLEECTTSNDVFSSWRAVDEKLRRAVGIHLIAAAHPRAKAVLAAARQAALLGDPRFVQVLDAVEDGDVVYVVREWLPDATGLDTLLLAEPLEAYESYQLVRQLAEAMAAAHRRGLAHLRLTPACVLRTDSGQYRIDGIAVNAALRGIQAEADTAAGTDATNSGSTDSGSTAADRDAARKADAALRDTRAIGALLFASLTHRWPYPEGAHGLQGLPRDLGTVPAERVRANVHRGLSDLTARILCTPPGGKLTPITTPQDLAKAVTELPKVRQPEPEPLVLPTYPSSRAAPRTSAAAAPTIVTPHPPAPPHAAGAPQPALPGRSGRALKWAVSLVVLGAIALGSWGTAEALMSRNNAGSADTTLSQGSGNQHPGQGGEQHTLKQLPMSSATEFSPLEATTIAGAKAPLAIDGDDTTAWVTYSYNGYPNFGNLPTRKDGSGIVVDLGSVQSVSEVKVLLPFAGQTQEILAAPADATTAPNGLSGYTQRISNNQLLSGTSLDSGVLAAPVRTRFVLIHVTSLPADSAGGSSYRGGISEIHVLG